jgi:hypothetical protein
MVEKEERCGEKERVGREEKRERDGVGNKERVGAGEERER